MDLGKWCWVKVKKAEWKSVARLELTKKLNEPRSFPNLYHSVFLTDLLIKQNGPR
jgi:hypothetical protein